MKSLTILLSLTLVAAAYAGHGSSYVSRHDDNHGAYYGGDSHGDHHDYHHHPSYKFEYGVKDAHTGDHKSQWEHRDGDVVKGEYTLDEADGTKRVVKYSSDKKGGFHAHVERIGHAHHPQVYKHEHGHHY
jgi:Insect cuticle protein